MLAMKVGVIEENILFTQLLSAPNLGANRRHMVLSYFETGELGEIPCDYRTLPSAPLAVTEQAKWRHLSCLMEWSRREFTRYGVEITVS